ncbi:MAG: cell envelope integrity protein TolA [Desulfamplus sp.]|nr:cell envelope integrity protein TolA [Desulfamplus sp.]
MYLDASAAGGDDMGMGYSGPLFYGVSIVMHGILLFSMMFIHNIGVVKTMPPAVHVDLVSFSPGTPYDIPLAEEYESFFENEGTSIQESIPEIDSVAASEIETTADSEIEMLKPVEIQKNKTPENQNPKNQNSESVNIPDPGKESAYVVPREPEKDMVINEKPGETAEKQPDTGTDTREKKVSLKRKTYDEEKLKAVEEKKRNQEPPKVQQAVKDEKSLDSPDREKILASALERLRGEVEGRNDEKRAPGGNTGAAPGVEGGRASRHTINLYHSALEFRIRPNWVFNEKLAGQKEELLAIVMVEILHDGEIKDVWFETRSGNAYLDDSALKAIKKSNPLPPPPPGYSPYIVGFTFTPRGLR